MIEIDDEFDWNKRERIRRYIKLYDGNKVSGKQIVSELGYPYKFVLACIHSFDEFYKIHQKPDTNNRVDIIVSYKPKSENDNVFTR